MQFDARTVAARIMRSFIGPGTHLADCIRDMLATRRERLEHEGEFYRNLTAYCYENHLPVICEDDWKAAAYADRDARHAQRYAKGNVS